MQRVFRVVDTRELTPRGVKTTTRFNRSVGRFGVLTPILLAEVPDEDGVIHLHILDGNRRVRAARASRLSRIPAVVLKETTPRDRARLTLLCNFMRSNNFHTESQAIIMLGESEEEIGRAAGAIGLGHAKMQQLYRKIASMPDEVQRAMYEHRIPVTAATWVGSWPDDLQAEVVETLARRRYLNTPALKAMKASYDARFPSSVVPVTETVEHEGAAEWIGDDAADFEIEIPVPVSSIVGSPEAVTESVESEPVPLAREASVVHPIIPKPVPFVPPSSATTSRYVGPEIPAEPPPAVVPVAAREPVPAPRSETVNGDRQPGDDSSQQSVVVEPVTAPSLARPVADPFLARLDAELVLLARETRARELPRSVWVDRAMRAWERAETAGVDGLEMRA